MSSFLHHYHIITPKIASHVAGIIFFYKHPTKATNISKRFSTSIRTSTVPSTHKHKGRERMIIHGERYTWQWINSFSIFFQYTFHSIGTSSKNLSYHLSFSSMQLGVSQYSYTLLVFYFLNFVLLYLIVSCKTESNASLNECVMKSSKSWVSYKLSEKK